MMMLRRSLSTASSLIGRELYQGETVVRLILKDVKRRNALSLEMIEALTSEMEGVNTISKVRSVIISSEGPAFSSGHDLKDYEHFFWKAEAGSDLHQKIFDRCGNLMMLIRRMEIPVIAEVHGIAAAAGCQLVASCDVVIASDTSKFVVPGQKVGLFCSTPGIPLARAVPHKIALYMLLTGEPIDAQTALSCGLVSRIVPEKDVKFEALKVAEQIGQHSRSVTALGKTFFYSQTELGINDAYRLVQ
ncbi:enoyl-CoA hydratase/isomerase family protein [Necator americanus]|uniref:Enoyl-CoA hydratase domain-containing protein 3, mitochondrial n=1 Tax=Necator americanus TaxID=51031 RepID=W2TRD2_NECAM|nr:enoyl-CoA hydratase/isomerase family protein [Necator americanus]ETN83691.1 enoyl-CoA hydratase/isomerase family protein [Necator americanus]